MGFKERYERTVAEAAACCEACGRDPKSVVVVAVSTDFVGQIKQLAGDRVLQQCIVFDLSHVRRAVTVLNGAKPLRVR